MTATDFATVTQRCSAESFTGSMSFPAVVAALAAVNVEWYVTDLVLGTKTYYQATGGARTDAMAWTPAGPIADSFDPSAVQAAIRANQQGRIDYATFIDQVMAAGTIGYIVFLRGRQVLYLGRLGDQHLERFPQSN